MFLEAHFGEVSIPRTEVPEGEEDDLLVMDVTVDGVIASIDLISMVRPPHIQHFTGRRRWMWLMGCSKSNVHQKS